MVRQFQITIAENKVAEVTRFLHEREIDDVIKLHSEHVFLMIFRVTDDNVSALLGDLTELGLGRTFGRVDVVSLDASKPFVQRWKKTPGRKVRLTIEEILCTVQGMTFITFDFLMFLLAAALIAAAGLAGNSVVSVLAAMLVSPLMGPILGFCFGCVIHDPRLMLTAARNELIALLLTFFTGFMCGFLFLYWGPELGWPTPEMAVRGEIANLLMGVMVATASGIGVAVSITAGAINSLVGVAISASLLPPAVNAGMCINYGIFGPLIHGTEEVNRGDMFYNGGISFSLTCVNIACIIVACNITFWIKAVAPIDDSCDYYHDVKNLREEGLDYNFDRDFNEDQLQRLKMMHSDQGSKFMPTSSKIGKKIESSSEVDMLNYDIHGLPDTTPLVQEEDVPHIEGRP